MKTKILITLSLTILVSCQQKVNDPGWGIMVNPSAELVESSVVKGWESDRGPRSAIHFYDNVAHHGTKSLTIHSEQMAQGRWYTKVLLKPWSTYRFTGWIKTDNLQTGEGGGAGFRLDGFEVEYIGFTGTSDWTEVVYEFETGGDDAVILSCLYGNGSGSKGRVWFDDISFTLISSEELNPVAEIDVTAESPPMQEYIYGQFIEHLGKCIYGGIWAEMIEDRKFWYEPGTRESPWRVAGNRESIAMDRTDSFTGEQTPVLTARADESVRLVQTGLGLKENLDYEGHIVLKSSGFIPKVMVTLSAGTFTGTVEIEVAGNEYRSYPLKFTSPYHTGDASITIEPIGAGRLWIGTISLMPSDNIDGFRSDVMQLLKELDSPVYRWPGGNFVSGYNWKDGIGDRDRRPPRKNPAWTGIESNDVGMHEFIRFCELLDTEPYIAVNAGLGHAEEARQQVEYCNGDASTPMGRWRGANGSSEPWNVKWWSVGNEMYGSWQLGHMSTEAYVEKHNEFAEMMRSVDEDIMLIAVGDVGPWDEMMLTNCSDHMDLISEHFYVQDWHGGGLMTHVRQVPDAISGKAEAHRRYREEIPQLQGKDIQICMDEWNYWYGPHIYGELGTRYFYRDAMGIAAGINEFSRNSDIIFMANYAQTVNVIGAIKTSTTESVLASTGQVLKMYRHHFGTIPVSLSGDTRPLDIAAALTVGRDTLTLSVINPTYDRINVPVNIEGASASGEMEIWSVDAPDDMSYNEPGREMSVKIVKRTGEIKGSVTIEPTGIMIFRVPLVK